MPDAERGAVSLHKVNRSSLRRVLWTFGLLLPLALSACGGSTAKTAQTTPTHTPSPVATATPPPPPLAHGVYVITDNQTLVALNPADGSRRWTFPIGTASDAGLTATDRIVYTYDNAGIVALRASDGAVLWRHPARSFVADVNGVIYALTNTGGSSSVLTALDGVTGAPRWTTPIDGAGAFEIAGADIMVRETMVVAPGVPQWSKLYAVDKSSGRLLWHLEADAVGIGEFATYGDTLYMSWKAYATDGSTQAEVRAYRLSDGSLLWRTSPIQYFNHVVFADATQVYAETVQNLVTLRASDGSVAWSSGNSSHAPGQFISANGVLYVANFNSTVVGPLLDAVNATTGQDSWTHVFWTNPLNAPPVIANNVVYVATRNTAYGQPGTDPALYAFDSGSGQVLWRVYQAVVYPTINDGMLYTCDAVGTLCYALDPATGAQKWSVNMDGHLQNMVVG